MLQVQNISAWYASSQALFDVSLDIGEGEMVALMGRNGMGKTTTIRAICRLTPPATGGVILCSENLADLPAHAVAQRGIGLVPEGRRIFPNLSVQENLLVTARDGRWDLAAVYAFFPQLAQRKQQSGGTLSGGEQQMLAIGRALMTNPKLLILDEATEGLAPLVRREIWSAIHALKDQGQSALIVDKTIDELLPVVNRCFILEKGVSVWSGSAVELAVQPAVKDRYLGV